VTSVTSVTELVEGDGIIFGIIAFDKLSQRISLWKIFDK
jgi:hypothetical protein